QTYHDEALIRQMVTEQADMKIPAELIPYCPECGAGLEINKRTEEKGMVEDCQFHEQKNRYEAFLKENEGKKILFLEIGVGHTTPQFIRNPFQDMTAKNPNALFVTMNQKDYFIPHEIRPPTVRITDDIAEVFAEMTRDYCNERSFDMYLIEPKRNVKCVYYLGYFRAIQGYVKDHLFLDDDVLFPYIMEPAVQIGKYQNAYEELNQPYIDEHGIKMIRRETGGGAVYLDDRNMSFCFLFSGDNNVYGNY